MNLANNTLTISGATHVVSTLAVTQTALIPWPSRRSLPTDPLTITMHTAIRLLQNASMAPTETPFRNTSRDGSPKRELVEQRITAPA